MKEDKLNPEDFHMPAEWEKHEGTWLQWPHGDQRPVQQLKQEKSWLQMVDALHRHENIHISFRMNDAGNNVEHQLKIL